MKKLMLSLAVITAAIGANAQSSKETMKPFQFSVGLEAALPLGDFGDGYSFGIGGSVQGDYNVASDLAITANVGYISYSGKTVSFPAIVVGGVTVFPAQSYKNPTIGIIPLLAGIKYSFTPTFYGSAQIGAAIFTASGGGGNETTLAYAPGIGYKFTPNFDALLKYNGYSKNGTTNSSVGLRVAYTF